MADPNKNSFLSTFREEYIDPYPLTNFLGQGVDMLTSPTSGAKASYLHNDADGTSYELDHDWGVSAGLSYKF